MNGAVRRRGQVMARYTRLYCAAMLMLLARIPLTFGADAGREIKPVDVVVH